MAARGSEHLGEALARRSLAELRDAHPAEWERVARELDAVLGGGDAEALKAYAARVASGAGFRPATPGRSRPERAAESVAIQRHIAAERLRQLGLAAATGVSEGRVRFNLVNGWLAQRLLFARGLERKPVSLRAFGMLWPLLWQRRRLMPLVQPQGIYCFYSRTLVRELAVLVEGRPCLEIAAGEGTLARFLRAAGTEVTATDDGSWSAVRPADDVERLDARSALARHAPAVVLCSWPPAGNAFERAVFDTPSVQLYVVITTRQEFGAGDWDAYRRQQAFTAELDERLSRLVLPPETEPAVLVFRRRSSG